MEDAIAMIQKLVVDFQMIISNAHLIIDLLVLVLRNSPMSVDKEYFQQIFGIIMGINVAPILVNIYKELLENELQNKYIGNPKHKWPVFLKRFIYNGLEIFSGSKEEIISLINRFNTLRESITIDKWSIGNKIKYMDLEIFKGFNFHISSKLDLKLHQKKENKFLYLPYQSGHPIHSINN